MGTSFVRRLKSRFVKSGNHLAQNQRPGCRPEVEYLEDRTVPSFTSWDLNPDDDEFGGPDSAPRYFTNVGGVCYFAATDGIHGYELWKSDPTTGVTQMVVDLTPGEESTFQDMPSFDSTFFAAGNRLYFLPFYGQYAGDLWTSDGTAAGTYSLVDPAPGEYGVQFGTFSDVGGELYFGYNGGLWKTNGTVAGTVMVDGIPDGAVESRVIRLGSSYYFQTGMSTPEQGYWQELWTTDGTDAGTYKITDMPANSWFGMFRDDTTYWHSYSTVMGDSAYFLTRDFFNGDDLWKTDGTAAGTVLVKDLGTTIGWELTTVGSLVFFGSSSGLWRTDGTTAGTYAIPVSYPENLTAGNGYLYFIGPDPDAPSGGWQGETLWRSDGTTAGTTLILDPTYESTGDFDGRMVFVQANDTLYFSAVVRNQNLTIDDFCICSYHTPTGGSGLPSYDIVAPAQTTGGFITYVPGGPGSDGYLFFQGWDIYDPHGYELWRMNL